MIENSQEYYVSKVNYKDAGPDWSKTVSDEEVEETREDENTYFYQKW